MTVAKDFYGLHLTGQYLSGKQEAARTVGETTYPGRYKVSILVGDRVYQVEYKDESAASAALGAVESMGNVSIPVGVRSAKGFTFYFGR